MQQKIIKENLWFNRNHFWNIKKKKIKTEKKNKFSYYKNILTLFFKFNK